MIHQIINLKVPMHDVVPVPRPSLRVPEEGDHLVEMRDLADGLVSFNVNGSRLGLGDGGEGFELAVVKARGFAEGGDVDGGGRDAMQLSQSMDGCSPPVFCRCFSIHLYISIHGKRESV